MNFKQAFVTVFRKELRELLRDRRALFFLLAPPFILPAIAILGGVFIGVQAIGQIAQGFPVAVANSEAAPALMDMLAASQSLTLVELPADGSWGEALVKVTLPDDFQERVEAEATVYVTLTTRDGAWTTGLAAATVRGVITRYGGAVLDQRLAARGLSREWLNPVAVGEEQAPSQGVVQTVTLEGDAGAGGGNPLSALFLPLAVTSWLVGGGLGLIVDTTVGEKERRTMEALLLTPASRLGIVAGKLAVVFIASMVVMSLWLAEGVALSVVAGAAPALLAAQEGALNAGDVLASGAGQALQLVFYLVLLILPFIVTLNSLVMAWCAFASTYRESNLMLFLIQLALPALVIVSVFSLPADPGLGWYLSPLLGTIVAIRDLFSGALMALDLAVALMSGVFYAVLTLALSAYVFSREWALVRGI